MSKQNLKIIAAAVLISQAVTLGLATGYKEVMGSPVPALALTDSEMKSVVADAIEQGVKDREKEQIELVTAGLYAKHAQAPEKVPEDLHVYGDLRARFTLAEFSDLECGFCKKMHPTLHEIVEKSNGAVNWQWRHLPLSFHNPSAQNGAHASECFAEQKGNKGFWVFIDQWFSKSRMNGGGIDDVTAFAASLGADRDKFNACMDSGKYNQLIKDNAELGEKIGATGTPATVIYDNLTKKKAFISGAQPRSVFITKMKEMLAEADAEEAKQKAAAEGKPIDALENVLPPAAAE